MKQFAPNPSEVNEFKVLVGFIKSWYLPNLSYYLTKICQLPASSLLRHIPYSVDRGSVILNTPSAQYFHFLHLNSSNIAIRQHGNISY